MLLLCVELSLPVNQKLNDNFIFLNLVCVRTEGSFISNNSIGEMCKSLRTKVEGLDGFHFHMFRHTYSTNLISNGVAPKDVQELLGHSDLSTTMNIYTHRSDKSKKNAVMMLDEMII